MGRRRSGFLVTSIRKAEEGNRCYTPIFKQPPFTGAPHKVASFSPEVIKALKSMSKEQIARVLFKKSENPDWW